jgi:surfeit locus 1 family protein
LTRKTFAFALLALAFAALFARLGIWQLDRLHQRRALNQLTAARLAHAPEDVRRVWSDTGDLRYRRVTASGTLDYAHELVLTSRTHNGSPGVDIITPLRLAGTDTALLVNRGWVYSPDAIEVDLARWREADSVTIEGYLDDFATGGPAIFRTPSSARGVRRLLRDSLASALPYPIAAGYLVVTSPSGAPRDSAPVRLEVPALDEGPHLSYAIQWFFFAAVAVVGAGYVVAQGRKGR